MTTESSLPGLPGSKADQIARVRNGAGRAEVPASVGKIVAMFGCEKVHRLYVIGENGVSSGVMADQIDPERTNLGLPFMVHREELLYGIDTTFVVQTLGIANLLLRQGSPLPNKINREEAFLKALSVAQNLGAIADTISSLAESEENVRKRIAEHKITRAILPHTQNLKGRINQAIGHLADAQADTVHIAQMFYPKTQSNEGWSQALTESLRLDLGTDNPNFKACEEVISYLRNIRNYRNALHHAKQGQEIIVTDYDIESNGNLIAPTIEVIHKDSPASRRDIVQFLRQSLLDIAQAFETIFATCCENLAEDFANIAENHVVSLSEGELVHGSRYIWQSVFKDGFPTPPVSQTDAMKG